MMCLINNDNLIVNTVYTELQCISDDVTQKESHLKYSQGDLLNHSYQSMTDIQNNFTKSISILMIFLYSFKD